MRSLVLLTVLAGCSDPVAPVLGPVPTTDPDVLRLVAIGDIGKDTPTREAVIHATAAVCAERGCDLGLLLGDNLYDRGMTSADDPGLDALLRLSDAGIPWFLVHGNHDYGHAMQEQRASWARDWAARTDGFDQPAPYYALSAGPADLFALDTNRAFWLGERAQKHWLSGALKASDARWKLVFGHHTYRSEGRHGNAGAYEGWVSLPFASGRSLEELFEATLCTGADLYLSGHDHSLQLLEHCGTTLVVSGAGSAPRPLRGHGNHPTFARESAGFAWIELGQRGRVLFFGADGVLLYESDAIEPRPMVY